MNAQILSKQYCIDWIKFTLWSAVYSEMHINTLRSTVYAEMYRICSKNSGEKVHFRGVQPIVISNYLLEEKVGTWPIKIRTMLRSTVPLVKTIGTVLCLQNWRTYNLNNHADVGTFGIPDRRRRLRLFPRFVSYILLESVDSVWLVVIVMSIHQILKCNHHLMISRNV